MTSTSNDKTDPIKNTIHEITSNELNKQYSQDDDIEKLASHDVQSHEDKESIEKILDEYSGTKSIVLKKTEILAKQYNSIWYRSLLLFSAFLIGYGYGLDSNIRYVYTGYAQSAYGTHSLISTVGVINAVIGGASQLVIARLSDVFGRLELLIVSIVFYTMGTIIQSQAYDIQRFCAGSVFYNLGYVGVLLVVTLIIADFSTLRWRSLYQCTTTLPFIINTWISGDITEAVNPLENWSWGIGMWAFIFPLSALPFVLCILHMRLKAGKTKEWKIVKQQKTFYQSHGIWSFLIELYWRLDIMGILLLTVLLGCILVPLTVAGGVTSKWAQGEIIGPLVLGVVLIPIFGAYETYIARYPMASYKLIKDRGVWSALIITFLLNFMGSIYGGYLYTVLVVAMNQSIKSATRIAIISSFVSVVWSPLFGVIVAYVRRLKLFILCGISLFLTGLGLLYHFRGYESSKNGVIGAMVVMGIGMTMYTGPVSLTVQASTNHDNMATVISLLYTVFRIGSGCGSAVSGAIWSNLLPKRLESDLSKFGNSTLSTFAYFSPYEFIVEYPYGSQIRMAMIESYRYIQKMEITIALIFCSLMLIFAFLLRDPELIDEQAQNDLSDDELINTKSSDPIADLILKWIKKDKPVK
ncbi:Siderophore iron transporter [Wickerhamomyces ciferrii]|uniref:Siderophore iron transporter n=1 Tax=Wickerhamomyces ciferrii (strain ATCC 14091 / BCRC 22168 / CBS 111 / JCM 3599 / NBRC 0793 / NRRL Y-1031 F-60-10) TaxID=1206466 RepID=K0KUM2_WICCF|nr:Siderophore iron transporter [Wickerhamomyces ciferrii]CCH46886.1 Siderophore iron transporter [Wickerhamomyces ciferrii]